MLLWKGPKILKFDLGFIFHQCCTSDLDMWLRAATENGVEELRVGLTNHDDVDPFPENEYFAPQRLYSCSSIRKLSLSGCNMKINRKVQWDQLRCLTIEGVRLSEHVISQVVGGAPQLEVLTLRVFENCKDLNIESSSLKTLKIEKIGADATSRTKLRIGAPNVETLEISGVPYSRFQLMNVSSLIRVTVGFTFPDHFYENDRFCVDVLLEEPLEQVFQSIHHVERVTLSESCIKEILCHSTEPFVSEFDAKNSLKSKTNLPKSYDLLHLKTVEITWLVLHHNSIFPFIETLLKSASKLEKMVFRPTHGAPPESLFLVAQKLLSMQRSSPAVKVIMCKD